MGYRIVRVNTEILSAMFTQGNRWPDREDRALVIESGLPEGAELVAMSMDLFFLCDQIALRYSHPSWPDQPAGHPTPELQLRFRLEDATAPAIVQG